MIVLDTSFLIEFFRDSSFSEYLFGTGAGISHEYLILRDHGRGEASNIKGGREIFQ
jgi:hypothetical protein